MFILNKRWNAQTWCLGCMIGAAFAALVLQCGARTPLLVSDDTIRTPIVEAGIDARDARSTDAAYVFLCADTSADDAACTNLECQVASCGAGEHTMLSGVVLDPAGVRPVYNVLVYVPNGSLEPMSSGPVCSSCQAAASGSPIVSAVTDADGAFTLVDPPSGSNIPLVMQLGKWRRRVEVPEVRRCEDNVFTDRKLTRLPKMQAEGDIPQIAFATGCDWAECFLHRTIGIDPSEFTGPSNPGRVHVYRGQSGDQPLVVGPGDANALWGSYEVMKKYDLVFNACECNPVERYASVYAMKQYIDGGGRFFGTHYHYNWFAPPTGPTDYQAQAPWLGNVYASGPGFLIDTSFPRGKAFADWAQSTGLTTTYAQIDLTDTREDVPGLAGGLPGHGMYTNTTQWIFHPDNQTLYLSFNAPTDQPPSRQCGRAVFSDVHLSGAGAGGSPFPAYCADARDHEKNEQALEFLFFDLWSCVQDDTRPPEQPCGR